ncbi:DUF2812 domain-containing protein [Levilactobacillus fujinensis]|nr:DUF2812 domain-containing protein [Levilactobacillus fujinensis]
MMKKFKLFLDLNTEEDWINGVQAGGHRLTGVNPFLHRYTFQRLASAEDFNPYTRLDFRDRGLSRQHYQDYQQLFNDSGWRLVTGSRHGGIQYFQQMSPASGHDIFSDDRSKQRSRNRDSRCAYVNGAFFLSYFYFFMHSSSINLLDPRSWYLTEGLWHMQGEWFWKAFAFETPFVLLRMIPAFLFLILGIYYFSRVIHNGDGVWRKGE